MAIQRDGTNTRVDTGAVVPATGLRALASGAGQMADAANQIQQVSLNIMEKEAVTQARKLGAEAVTVDDDGKLAVKPPPFGGFRFREEFQATAYKAYLAETGLAAQQRANEFSLQYPDNPNEFEAAFNGAAQAAVDAAPDELKGSISLEYRSQGARQKAVLENQLFQRRKDEAIEDAKTYLSNGASELSNFAYQMGPEQAEELIRRKDELKVKALQSDAPPSWKHAYARSLDFDVEQALISSEAERLYDQSKDVKASNKYLQEYVGGKDSALSFQERESIRHYAMSRVQAQHTLAQSSNAAFKQIVSMGLEDLEKADPSLDWQGPGGMDISSLRQYTIQLGDPKQSLRFAEAEARRNTLAQAAQLPLSDLLAVAEGSERMLRLEPSSAAQQGIVADVRAMARNVQKSVTDNSFMSVGEQYGIVTPTTFNPKDPASWTNRHAEYIRLGAHHGMTGGFLKPEEIDVVSSMVDGFSFNERVQWMGELSRRTSRPAVNSVLKEIAKGKPVAAMTMALSQEAPEVAREVMAGEMLLKENPDMKIDNTVFNQRFENAIGDAISGQDFPEFRGAVYQASRALYAAREGSKPDGPAMTKAVQDIVGGVFTYNGEKMIAPRRGMDKDQFYDLLSGLNDADLKKAFGGTAKSQNGDIVTVDDLIDRATFRYAGPGEYIVEFKGLGTPYIENAEGEIVRTSGKFSVNAIMGGR